MMPELLGSYFIETWELVFRLVLAAGLGFLVGLDRSIKNKPLGFRPFMLVSLGACLFSMTILELGSGPAGSNGIDPVNVGRVMQGVIGGIGFLGAGAIIRSNGSDDLRGSATGAGIWVVGGIGMTVGFGLYALAVAATIVAVIVFVFFGVVREEVADRTKDMNEKT